MAREVVGVQTLVAAARQRRAQLQPAKVPVRAKHRGRGLDQQRVLTARREIAVRQPQRRVHDTALLDVLAGVGIPGHQGLMDQLIKPGAYRRKNNLIQQQRHQQVAVTLQGFSLLRGEQSGLAAHDRDSSLPLHRAATN
jgi:hypothetical protein